MRQPSDLAARQKEKALLGWLTSGCSDPGDEDTSIASRPGRAAGSIRSHGCNETQVLCLTVI